VFLFIFSFCCGVLLSLCLAWLWNTSLLIAASLQAWITSTQILIKCSHNVEGHGLDQYPALCSEQDLNLWYHPGEQGKTWPETSSGYALYTKQKWGGLNVSSQETGKISAKGDSDDLQPPNNQGDMDSAMSWTEYNNPLSSHVPGHTLRMIFKRLYSDNLSTRLVTAPSSQTHEKTSPPDTSHPSTEMPECQGSHMPLSVLCVDLQISSSSKESDLEWYTSWKGRLTSSVSVFEGMAGLNRGGQRGQALSA
jgi:hypothetical protein